jgi:hypothetical protein
MRRGIDHCDGHRLCWCRGGDGEPQKHVSRAPIIPLTAKGRDTNANVRGTGELNWPEKDRTSLFFGYEPRVWLVYDWEHRPG